MKIGFVMQPWDEVIPRIGGNSSIPIVSYQLARRLVRRGHDAILYGRRAQAEPKMEFDDEGIMYRRIPILTEDLLLKPLRLLNRLGAFRDARRPYFASSLYYPAYAIQIARDLGQRQPDIIHIHNFSQYVPIIRQFNPDAKIVLHMHCEWLNQLEQKMIGRRLGHVNMVIGCSEYNSVKVSDRFPEYSVRCQTLYNGVDLEKFPPNSTPSEKRSTAIRLLFVGRVSPEKGLHVLLDAFGKVLETFPDTTLQIVGGIGSAPYEFLVGISDDEQVRDLARFYPSFRSDHDFYYNQLLGRLPANQMQKVSFIDHVPHSRLKDVYHHADIFINSSLSEAFPVPIPEAMASGVPVVGSAVGGIPELVRHEKTGLLFQPGDSDSLAKSIIRLINKEDLRQKLINEAFQEVERKYSWENIAEELIHKYQTLLNA